MSTLNNSVRLTGYLGGAPEVKFTNDEKKFVRISLATNNYRKNANGERIKEVNWHPVILWDHQATLAEKYLDKGSKVAIEGRLVSRYYTDKDGIKRHTMEVIANEIDFLNKIAQN